MQILSRKTRLRDGHVSNVRLERTTPASILQAAALGTVGRSSNSGCRPIRTDTKATEPTRNGWQAVVHHKKQQDLGHSIVATPGVRPELGNVSPHFTLMVTVWSVVPFTESTSKAPKCMPCLGHSYHLRPGDLKALQEVLEEINLCLNFLG